MDMNAAELQYAVDCCREIFVKNSIAKKKYPENKEPDSSFDILEHCHAMLDEIEEKHIPEKELAKANRWLGFVQCSLWTQGYVTIDQLKKHIQTTTKRHVKSIVRAA